MQFEFDMDAEDIVFLLGLVVVIGLLIFIARRQGLNAAPTIPALGTGGIDGVAKGVLGDTESYKIEYNKDGMPTSITRHSTNLGGGI